MAAQVVAFHVVTAEKLSELVILEGKDFHASFHLDVHSPHREIGNIFSHIHHVKGLYRVHPDVICKHLHRSLVLEQPDELVPVKVVGVKQLRVRLDRNWLGMIDKRALLCILSILCLLCDRGC